MANLYTLERAKWTTEKRKQYLKDHPENHAGPNGSFPIEDASDVNDAWRLAGHADNPDAVRAKIKSIAKRLRLESGLPDTATEDDEDKERSMGAEHTHEALTRADSANHEPMTGTHSHAHPAMGSQGDDETHDHKHSHDGDADHDHTHSEERAIHGAAGAISMYVPITRSTDSNGEWIVEGQATSDTLDYYDTVFDFESAKKAFARWRGNIREQHDGKKAVGHAIEWTPDEENRCIILRSRISKGAPDTWEKVLDGTLTGYSVSLDPRTVKTEMIQRGSKRVKKYSDYDYLEVSLVDAPGSPGCDIAIVRADGVITDVLDASEEPAIQPEPSSSPTDLDRTGARVSSDTRAAMHEGIGHALKSAVSSMKNCGCDNCTAAMKMIDPDGDNDIDMGGYDDPDGDWQSLYGGDGNGDTARAIMGLSGLIEDLIEKQLSPVYARLQGIAGAIARSNTAPTEASLHTIITGAIERAMNAATTANASNLAEVRASQETEKERVDSLIRRVEVIANTPVPGAPIMNTNSLPRPALAKQIPTDPPRDPYAPPKSTGSSVADAMRTLSEQGWLNTEQRQVDALAAGLLLQQQGRRQ